MDETAVTPTDRLAVPVLPTESVMLALTVYEDVATVPVK